MDIYKCNMLVPYCSSLEINTVCSLSSNPSVLSYRNN